MELSYVQSESTVRPQNISFDTHGVRLVRNITEDIRNNGDTETKYYVYEEAVLTHAEFQTYTNTMLMQAINPTFL
jgi:hypothetical protein